MPLRYRKRSPAAYQAQDGEPSNADIVLNPPVFTSQGPRRSARRTLTSRQASSSKDGHTGTTANQGQTDAIDAMDVAPVEDVARKLEKEDSDAASALRRLEEMETSFKKDIKKRRLQIEQSFEEADSSQPLSALRHRGVSGRSDVIHLDRILLTPDVDKEPSWEPTLDEEKVGSDQPVEVIKGANRAPAVDSDYLPLPWKGRLGYVSSVLGEDRLCSNVNCTHRLA